MLTVFREPTLSKEQITLAVSCLKQFANSRQLNQTQLQKLSGVPQPTISKIWGGGLDPTYDMLTKLFKALGLKLNDILHESEQVPSEILGYMATPLTAVVSDSKKDQEIRRIVELIRKVAAHEDFVTRRFDLYWPGDHTHPVQHPQLSPIQVYLTDRSQASTFDFIILLCASPSYGVGQENEIATQGGLPAIRLVPEKGMSRMLEGSFLYIAVDINRLTAPEKPLPT